MFHVWLRNSPWAAVKAQQEASLGNQTLVSQIHFYILQGREMHGEIALISNAWCVFEALVSASPQVLAP